MKRIVLLFALASALSACQFLGFNRIVGNGVSVETTLEVGDFDAISLKTSMNVVFTQTSDPQPLTFVCDENLLEYYVIEVEEGTLKVSAKPGTMLSPRVNTVLTVQAPVLNAVKVSGSGDVAIDGGIVADGDFSLHVSGSGDISVDGPVACDAFTASVSGSGDISVDDYLTCREFSASTSGSGDIDVKDVSTILAGFKTSGSGGIRVEGTLTCGPFTATTTGSGGIGIDALTADSVETSATGSGSIRLTGLLVAGEIKAATTGSGTVLLEGSARSLSASSSGSGRVDAAHLTLLRN
jgi:hypothetical protein